ncbi:MAG: alpha/beta hydrolase [Acidobacteria bacterium]|nr:alpha/beta hydrolase [Acidobacteriota bacterium]
MVTIRGANRENPVVLFLHGGPGSTLSPFGASLFHDWEQSFTVVQWDQRGAGRTYAKSGPSIEPTMTIDRMTQDGIEVAEYVRAHLDKKKIVLIGGSWGAVLGVYMARARPDLFHAYVGVAQIVSTEDWSAGYARTLELARQATDQQSIAELESIGPPPWNQLRKFGAWSRVTRAYEAKSSGQPLELRLSTEYASDAEQQQWAEAANFSQAHFFGLDMRGPLELLNLPTLGSNFGVPVFILQGDADLKAVPKVTRAYFDQLRAPEKEFILVPQAGHEPNAEMLKAMLQTMKAKIEPLAMEP